MSQCTKVDIGLARAHPFQLLLFAPRKVQELLCLFQEDGPLGLGLSGIETARKDGHFGLGRLFHVTWWSGPGETTLNQHTKRVEPPDTRPCSPSGSLPKTIPRTTLLPSTPPPSTLTILMASTLKSFGVVGMTAKEASATSCDRRSDALGCFEVSAGSMHDASCLAVGSGVGISALTRSRAGEYVSRGSANDPQ